MPEHLERPGEEGNKFEYFKAMPLEDILTRLKGFDVTFIEITNRYDGLEDQSSREMKQEDQQRLADCMGDLLPMAASQAVQEELLSQMREGKVEESTHNRITSLSVGIMTYLTGFENTGIIMYEGGAGWMD